MHIWLISIFEQTPIDEAPITRFNKIADQALKNGHQVTFFASTFKHNTKVFRFEETNVINHNENLELVFIKSTGYFENISLRRLFAHYHYARNLIDYIETKKKPDLILVALPPISNAYELVKWSKKNNVKIVVDIIDPWPDLFRSKIRFSPKWIQNLILFPLTRRVRRVFEGVSAVTAISNQYLSWANSYFSEIPEKDCFYPAVSFADTRNELKKACTEIHKDNSQLTVVYAGSFASSYDILTILKAAEILDEKYGKEINFILAGSGPQEGLVHKYVLSHSNLVFKGRLSREELLKVYGLSDIGLTQHIKGATQSITYKLFDLLSCGLPILNSLESEMKEIILNNQVGMFNSPGDYEKLASQIIQFHEDRNLLNRYKENALNLTKNLGDSEIVYGRYIKFLESIFEKSDQKLDSKR